VPFPIHPHRPATIRRFEANFSHSLHIPAGPSFANLAGMNNQFITLPPSRTLTGFASEQGCDDGLAIESLATGTMLIVRTDNSEYHIVVLDRDRVLVEGGAIFPESVPAVFQGASAGGNLVKTGWIGVGLHMELFVEPKWVKTSPVRSIVLLSPRQ
jgi:hypothetical protein